MAIQAQGDPKQSIHPPSSLASADPEETLWRGNSSAEDATFTSADWKPKWKLDTCKLVKILQVTAQKMPFIIQKKFQEAKQTNKQTSSDYT